MGVTMRYTRWRRKEIPVFVVGAEFRTWKDGKRKFLIIE